MVPITDESGPLSSAGEPPVPGKHLRVSTDGDVLHIRLSGAIPNLEAAGVTITILLLVLPGFAWLGISQLHGGRTVIGIAACLWDLLVVLPIVLVLVLEAFAVIEELVLSARGAIHHKWALGRWDVHRHRLPAESVEAVVTAPVRSGKPKQTSVQIVGASDWIEFAPERRLTREEKCWIRDAAQVVLDV
jgi:hypothetical protein